MIRLILGICLALSVSGCQKEFECVDEPVTLTPEPHDIGETKAFRLLYLGENGLTVTTNANVIPWYVQHSVWVELGDDRPTGAATIVDLSKPGSPIELVKRENAIVQAHAGAIGHWAGNLALERSQLLAESSPESDAYKKALKETGETQDVLGDDKMSLFTMDRRRRLRTAVWAQPKLEDFVKKPAPKRWFATPECAASGEMPPGYLMTNIDQKANRKLWKYLFSWTGQPPTVPAIW